MGGRQQGAQFPVYNPSTGEVWTKVADASRADAAAAIAAAEAAQPAWAALAHSERARLLSKAADVLEPRAEGISGGARSTKAAPGSARRCSRRATASASTAPRAAAAYQVNGEILPSDHGKLSLVVREPLGVVSVISPWNFPLILSSRGFAVALAVGNTIVLKPSEETPVSGGLLIARGPRGSRHPEGRVQRRHVLARQRRRGRRRADLEPCGAGRELHRLDGGRQQDRGEGRRAAQEVLRRARRQGRADRARRRRHRARRQRRDVRLVHAPGSDLHVGGARSSSTRTSRPSSPRSSSQNTKKLKVGNPREMGNCIGPIINQKQLDKIRDQVDDAVAKGAKVLCGGKHKGLFFQPTILTDVTRDMKVMREETFGPIAPDRSPSAASTRRSRWRTTRSTGYPPASSRATKSAGSRSRGA